MNRISLCMIVKNEEALLERCLESAAPWVDEIILVDTGSSDRTLEIAKKFTPHSYHFKWIDDFAAARNFALSKASGEWILALDASDILPAETGSRLRQLVSYASPETGYYLFGYSPVGAPIDLALKRNSLFRNHPRLRYHGRVHEQLSPPQESGFSQAEVSLRIIEDRPDPDSTRLKERLNYYTALLEKEAAEHTNSPSVFFHLASSYIGQTRFQEARKTIDHLLTLEWHSLYSDGTAHLLCWYIHSCMARQEQEKAQQLVTEGQSFFARYPNFQLKVSEFALASHNLQAAEKMLGKMINSSYSPLPQLCPSLVITYWRFQRLAEVYYHTRRLEEALELLTLISEKFPTAPATYDTLSRVHQKKGTPKLARDFAQKYQDLLEREGDSGKITEEQLYPLCTIPTDLFSKER